MPDVQKEIEEFFVEYAQRWSSQRYSTLKELWDREDPAPFYRAMDREQPTTTWAELERYWEPDSARRISDELWNVFCNLRVKIAGPDMAIVLFDLQWNYKGPNSKPIGGSDPGMAVLRRRPQGWRMIAYAEACMHPTAYSRAIAQAQARPAFARIIEERAAGQAKAEKAAEDMIRNADPYPLEGD